MKNFFKFPILNNDRIFYVFETNIYEFNLTTKINRIIFHNQYPIYKLFFNKKNLLCFVLNNKNFDLYTYNIDTLLLKQITFFQSNQIYPVYFKDDLLIYTINDRYLSLSTYSYDIVSEKIELFKLQGVNYLSIDKEDCYWQKNGYAYLNWKNYKGGKAGKIYKNNNKLIDLPSNALMPLIWQDKICFIYDNAENGNIFCIDQDGQNLTQLTFEKDFKIENIMLDNNRIIYTKLGDIFIYNLLTNVVENIKIPYIQNNLHNKSDIKNFITDVNISDNSLVINAKGNIFEGHLINGVLKKINTNLRYKYSLIMKNKNILAMQEAPFTSFIIFENSIEIKKYILEQQKIVYFTLSSDEKYVIFCNQKNQIRSLNLETSEEKTIFESKYHIDTFSLCANNEYIIAIVYSSNISQVKIININTLKVFDILPQSNVKHAVFDKLNRFIMLYCNNYELISDSLKFNYCFNESYKVCCISLIDSPINQYWKMHNTTEIIKLNDSMIEECSNKIEELPIDANAYFDIHQIENDEILLLYKDTNIEILKFSLKTFKTEVVLKDIETYYIKEHSKHIVIKDKNKLYALNYEKINEEIEINVDRIFYYNNIQDELQNKFDELCFLIENLFWNKNFDKNSWKTIKQKYQNEIERFKNFHDFDSLLNQLQGEMQTSHAFIYSNSSNDIYANSLGGSIKFDYEKNKYYIDKIFNHNIVEQNFSPLRQQNIKNKSYINKINNIELSKIHDLEKITYDINDNFFELEIEEFDNPNNKKIIELKTIKNQCNLIYQTFINDNVNYIKQISNNEIGYIHIPDMAELGYKHFFAQYKDQFNFKSLIIDLRNNRGGNISHLIFDYLSRKIAGYELPRNTSYFQSLPMETTYNKFVFLTNENTASDGEIFTAYCKLHKLGTIIGKRTWGGIIGIMPRFEFIDNTLSSQAEYHSIFYDENFNNIENYGIDPDIEIDNDNDCVITPDKDKQLNKAIQFIISNKQALNTQ